MTKDERIESFYRLDKVVKERGLTFYTVAKALGLSKSLFSDWKSGKSVPKVDKMIPIADYLGITIEYIIYG